MKRVFILSTILMIAGAMNAWAAACEEGAAGKYGAITIATVDGKCVATLDFTDTGKVEILNDIKVNDIQMSRSISGKAATIMLPFDIQTWRLNGCQAFKFVMVTKDWAGGKFVVYVDRSHADTLFANTPYVLVPAGGGEMSFNLSYLSEVIFNTTKIPESDSSNYSDEYGKWEFVGTYSYKKWQENDSDIGRIYGFAAEKKDNAKIGDFVKVKAGAFIKPMRAYLRYTNPNATQSRPGFNKAKIDDVELPESMEVRIIEEDGTTTSLGHLNTATGEITLNGWYDMKGRKLDKKPTQKGTYFNNGKKVVIK